MTKDDLVILLADDLRRSAKPFVGAVRNTAAGARPRRPRSAPVELEQVARVRQCGDERDDAVRPRRNDVTVVGDPEVAPVEAVLQPTRAAAVAAARRLL